MNACMQLFIIDVVQYIGFIDIMYCTYLDGKVSHNRLTKNWKLTIKSMIIDKKL